MTRCHGRRRYPDALACEIAISRMTRSNLRAEKCGQCAGWHVKTVRKPAETPTVPPRSDEHGPRVHGEGSGHDRAPERRTAGRLGWGQAS